MFVSLSAALVQACGFGEERREEDSVVAAQGGRRWGWRRDGTKKRRRGRMHFSLRSHKREMR